MNIKVLLAACAISLLASGCANILYRTEGMKENRGPYFCTCAVAETIATAFRKPSGPEGGIAQAYATLFLPITVVDLPLDATVDTVLLPYDLIRTWR